MSASLIGVEHKLKRAKYHFDTLESKVADADRGDLYRLAVEPDSDRGYYLVKAKKIGSDEDWPLILGDFVHNLFTALDHLVGQLVRANGKQPTARNEFGVFLDPGKFHGKEGADDFKGVHPDGVAAISACQPFNQNRDGLTGDNHPLWILRQLDIADKHRLIHTVALAPEEVTLTFQDKLLKDQVELFDLSDRILHDGTEVCRISTKIQPKLLGNSALSLRYSSKKQILLVGWSGERSKISGMR